MCIPWLHSQFVPTKYERPHTNLDATILKMQSAKVFANKEPITLLFTCFTEIANST